MDRNETCTLKQASSTPGFTSVSLRVPSADPLPTEDTAEIRPQVVGQPPGNPQAGKPHVYHTLDPHHFATSVGPPKKAPNMYHTLEPPELTASERPSEKPRAKHQPTLNPTHFADTSRGPGWDREEGKGGGGGAVLNPDNRTDLKVVTHHFDKPQQNFTRSSDTSTHTNPKQHQQLSNLPHQARTKMADSCQVMHKRIEEETVDELQMPQAQVEASQGWSIDVENVHKYDEVEIGGGRSKEDLDGIGEAGEDKSRGDEDRSRGGEREGDKGIDHKYDEVLTKNMKAEGSPSELPHSYHVLEDNRESNSNSRVLFGSKGRSQTHVQVIPKPNPRKEHRDSDRRAVKTDGGHHFTKRNSFHHSRCRDFTQADMAKGKEGRVSAGTKSNEPPMSAPPPPTHRTTYSSASSQAVGTTGQAAMFDDPEYATTFKPSLTKIGSAPSDTPHNCTHSLRQPQKVSYELTSTITTTTTTGTDVGDDLSELETTNMGGQATMSLPTLFDDPGYEIGLNLKKEEK